MSAMTAAWRRTVQLVLPLSWRNLRRRKAGAALTALSLALSVATFLLFGGYFSATRQAVRGRVAPLSLPADVVVLVEGQAQASLTKALDRVADVKSVSGIVWAEAYTSVGRRRVVGFDRSGLGVLTLVAGELPRVPTAPAAMAEVLLPQSVASAAGIEVGSTMTVALDTDGTWRERQFRVSGLFQGDDFLDGPVARREALGPLGMGPGDNGALAALGSDAVPEAVAKQVRGILGDGSATILTAEYPAGLAGSRLAQAFSPGNLAVFMVFAFSGLGVMNILLLSFLQRKRQMGVLKALGMDDVDLRQMFFGEGLYVAAAGAILGVVLTAALVAAFGRLTGTRFLISWWLVAWAIVLSFAVFRAAAWLPAALCQRASVSVLLQNKRVYIDPKTSCAECGRCGGF